MNKEFYAGNRKSLYQKLEAGSLVCIQRTCTDQDQ